MMQSMFLSLAASITALAMGGVMSTAPMQALYSASEGAPSFISCTAFSLASFLIFLRLSSVTFLLGRLLPSNTRMGLML